MLPHARFIRVLALDLPLTPSCRSSIASTLVTHLTSHEISGLMWGLPTSGPLPHLDGRLPRVHARLLTVYAPADLANAAPCARWWGVLHLHCPAWSTPRTACRAPACPARIAGDPAAQGAVSTLYGEGAGQVLVEWAPAKIEGGRVAWIMLRS
ncbi:hypothetical protein C8J57DRAFT_1511482 [Mycena rebaudengoi]|nr:hypothetical protein C8J57DRAFT_1511482 [Mycena rebaudengoi]